MNVLIRCESAAHADHLRRPPVYLFASDGLSTAGGERFALLPALLFITSARIGVELITLFHLALGGGHLAAVIKISAPLSADYLCARNIIAP